jgi:hypothetical protein
LRRTEMWKGSHETTGVQGNQRKSMGERDPEKGAFYWGRLVIDSGHISVVLCFVSQDLSWSALMSKESSMVGHWQGASMIVLGYPWGLRSPSSPHCLWGPSSCFMLRCVIRRRRDHK